MAETLFDRLDDDFDDHSGFFGGYYSSFNPNVGPAARIHYDLRAFHNDNITLPWTMLDMSFWNVDHFSNLTMDDFSLRRSISDRAFRRRTQSELDALTMANLDVDTMNDIDFILISGGNEEWPITDPDVTVAKDATNNYANTLTATVHGGVEKDIPSHYIDDILTDFNQPLETYLIEMTLPAFPAQNSNASSTLTITGGAVTDAMRTTDTEGDGLAAGQSMVGFYQALSNGITNSSFETDLTGWTSYNGSTLTRITTDHKFGTACMQMTVAQGAQYAINLTVGTSYMLSFWVKLQGTSGTPNLKIEVSDGSGNQNIQTVTNAVEAISTSNIVAGWTRYVIRFTPDTGWGTGLAIKGTFNSGGAGWTGTLIDGVMLQTANDAPAPFAVSTRTNSYIGYPTNGVVTNTAGWFALSITGSEDETYFNYARRRTLFSWGDNVNNHISVWWDFSTTAFWIERVSGGIATTKEFPLNPIDIHNNTVIGIAVYWDSNGLYVYVVLSPGAGAVTGSYLMYSDTNVTNITAADFVIGADWNHANNINANINWFAAGYGTPPELNYSADGTDGTSSGPYGGGAVAPASIFDSIFTNADPVWSDFDPSLSVRMLWTADTNATTVKDSFNLEQSFIDFSSDDNFAAPATTSIAFKDSLNDLSAGGNTYFRINRNSLLPNVDLTNVRAIRLRLNSLGDQTFKTNSIRVVPAWYSFYDFDPDTKRGYLAKALSQVGTVGTPPSTGTVYFPITRPENITYYVKFNSGHNPVGNDNIFKAYLRYDPTTGDHQRVELYCRNTQSRLRIYENIGGIDTEIYSTAINSNALTNETDYILIINLDDLVINASIYTVNGILLGTQVYTTGNQTVTHDGRGYLGYNFIPYNFDFTIDYIRPQSTEFAHMISSPFQSITPVIGAALQTLTSPAVKLVSQADMIVSGDASISTDANTGNPPPSTKIVRLGNQWFGGLRSADLVSIGDSKHDTVTGQIYISTSIRGKYLVALADANYSVAWLQQIEDLLPNQWNDFEILLPPSIAPTLYYLYVHQIGLYNDTFWIQDLTLNHDSIAWQASTDLSNWQSFLDSFNKPYSALNFKTPSPQIQVKATAFSDQAWIAGYRIEPIYSYTGH